jgi:hypothetical protein
MRIVSLDVVCCLVGTMGRKTIEVMSVMAQEGIKVGQEWRQNLAPQLIKRIDERLKKEKLI